MFSIPKLPGLLLWIPEWIDRWANYPGLEMWKFANLLIFLGLAFYLHHRFGKPIRNALRTRSEAIKQELAKAREDRDLALAKLAELDARFADLDAEVERIREKAKAEAEAERLRQIATLIVTKKRPDVKAENGLPAKITCFAKVRQRSF